MTQRDPAIPEPESRLPHRTYRRGRHRRNRRRALLWCRRQAQPRPLACPRRITRSIISAAAITQSHSRQACPAKTRISRPFPAPPHLLVSPCPCPPTPLPALARRRCRSRRHGGGAAAPQSSLQPALLTRMSISAAAGLPPAARQWPEVSGCASQKVLFSHVRRFFDLCNVQKCVTRFIYLGPLPTGRCCCGAGRIGSEQQMVVFPHRQPP